MSIRLGVIGCGDIAHFHIPAFQKVGFYINCIASSPNSKKIEECAEKHNIDNAYKDPKDLINSDDWDALLIISSIESTLSHLIDAEKYNKPIMVEKPVTLDYKKLKDIQYKKNIFVAFNRRFYSTVHEAKNFLKANQSSLIKVSIPERSIGPDNFNKFGSMLPYGVCENSVHVSDIINHIAGVPVWQKINSCNFKDKYSYIYASGKTKYGHDILLDLSFDSPMNFSIDILKNDQRYEMRPIEIGYKYNGMAINDPSEEIPIRRYMPNIDQTVFVNNKYDFLKPGFYEQAKAFYDFCEHYELDSRLANLIDAKNALKVLHQLHQNKY